MTAKELIEKLKNMPQDAPIVLEVLGLNGSITNAKLDEAFEGYDSNRTESIILQGFDFEF